MEEIREEGCEEDMEMCAPLPRPRPRHKHSLGLRDGHWSMPLMPDRANSTPPLQLI